MAHDKIFPPSSADRRINCPGSYLMCKDLADPKSDYADEGNAAHNLAQMALTTKKSPSHWLGKEVRGDRKNWVVNDEMSKAISDYVGIIRTTYMPGAVRTFVEHKVSLEPTLGLPVFGTADFCAINLEERTVHILDLKFGKGVVVEVIDNSQLKVYGLGVLGIVKELQLWDEIDNVELSIYQPRAFHSAGPHRSWVIGKDELMEWGETVVVPAYTECQEPNATVRAGDWCKFCPANRLVVCPELSATTNRLVESHFSPVGEAMVEPVALSNEKLGELVGVAKQVKGFLNSVEEEAHRRAESGVEIPGCKLVKKRSNRAWVDEAFAAEACTKALNSTTGHEETAYNPPPPPALKSPAQMEQALKRAGFKPKAREALLSHLWEKPDAGLVLVPDSDPRPEVPLLTGTDKSFDIVVEPDEDFFN